MKRRPWEKYWEEIIEPSTFLRNSKHETHPVRELIALYAAKYANVLEAGCATAVDLPIHEHFDTLYYGLDITEKFILEARKRYPNYWLEVGSILDIPLKSESIDTTYVKAVLEHMHPLEWVLGVQELWRVAKHQMILAFFNYNPDRPKAPILERMEKEDADRCPKQAFNNRIPTQDIQDVLFNLGATSWKRLIVGGKRDNTTKYKPYLVYVIEK